MGLKYRTSTYAEGVFNCYFFEKNLQGDIVAVYNSNGTKIGTYTYDAWGNFTITSSATGLERQIVYEINPFRYRSYNYDVETGWYYLQSRYYNPEWGRFLNADGYISTGTGFIGYNMYVYCNNNPIMFLDTSGNVGVLSALALGIILVSVLIIPLSQDPKAAPTSSEIEAARSAADQAELQVIEGDSDEYSTIYIPWSMIGRAIK